MDVDFWVKVVAPVIAVFSLGLNVFQYFRRNTLSHFEARRQLDRLEIEGERMRARHQQEGRDLQATYEGEVRERTGVRVDFRTAEDRRRDGVLAEEHGRQWNELFAEMTYYQRVLGEEPVAILFTTESFAQKLNRKARAVWRAMTT